MPDAISPKQFRACNHDLAAGPPLPKRRSVVWTDNGELTEMARETVSALESTSSPGYRKNASHADADENEDDAKVGD
jgi:hypothetical protein